ncbi:helix-turn-helix domain-containing protein (plasmid) [Streptomyces sp. BI20]|uniref:helix-turn-helix domain-containing protein n=1 Tax=Streptomyces sp. BI20 TaxID=3403460 RepID=UPI003C76D685
MNTRERIDPGRRTGDGSRLAGRLLLILEAVRAHHDCASLPQIVRHTGLAKSTAHRLLSELWTLNLVSRYGEHYCLGDTLRDLTAPLPDARQERVRRALGPLVWQLSERTGWVVGPAVTAGFRTRFVELAHGFAHRDLAARIEARPCAGTGVSARVLRAPAPGGVPGGPGAHGLVVDPGGPPLGVAAAAVGVYGPGGVPWAALSVGAEPAGFDAARAATVLRQASVYAQRAVLHLGEAPLVPGPRRPGGG